MPVTTGLEPLVVTVRVLVDDAVNLMTSSVEPTVKDKLSLPYDMFANTKW